jgi:AmmeMemoRadiSam system protein A
LQETRDVNPSLLAPDEQNRLLSWSRGAIEAALGLRVPLKVAESDLSPSLREPRGAFVTLLKHGELRGCIGKVDFDRPLWRNTMDAAVASALEDPRFPALTARELGEVALEISVLDPPVTIGAPDVFDPWRHGIIVELGRHSALLLPKVARQYRWDAARTLEAVCQKAGLAPDAWRASGARLKVFTTLDFGENGASVPFSA